MFTLFCVWTVAVSGLVPNLKVTLIVMEPSLALLDRKYIIPSKPANCSSMGCATVFSRSMELPPK